MRKGHQPVSGPDTPGILRVFGPSAFLATVALVLVACGGGAPTSPQPARPPAPPSLGPPNNAAPTIEAVVAQGRRPKQPGRFADLKETIDVSATVRDPETSLDELTYQWTTTAGAFEGTGRAVTWTAPESAATPAKVTLTLKVVESYGHPGQPRDYSHEVSSVVEVALHDSRNEVRRMAEQFLVDFSDTNIKDWQYIMRNFNAAACPNPGDVESEKQDVIRHYTEFQMIASRIGDGKVTVNFGSFCPFRGRPGDACAVVPVYWDSRNKDGVRSVAEGDDFIAAAYSPKDSRWYLCASDFEPLETLAATHSFYAR